MNNDASKHISKVISFLNKTADYAVLRNFEGLPNNNKSRDIDIIITKKSFKAIKDDLIRIVHQAGWKIITYLKSDRLITFVCGIIDPQNQVELVQWDFFVNTSVFGILLMHAKEFLKYKKFNGILYYIDTDCQFLDKYLYNRAVGKQYPEKYKAIRAKAKTSPIVRAKLTSLYHCQTVTECDRMSGQKLLFRAIKGNIRHRPFKTLYSISLFLNTYLKNYFCSNTGFSIGFTGPDGSGKTTIIDQTIKSLGGVFCNAYRYYHFRPQLFGNLGDVAQSAKLKRKVDREYEKPHRGRKTSIFNSLCRLLYYSADYILGYWIKVKSTIRITRIAIFDRYYTDIICDSKRSRIFLNYKFLYWFGRLFIPSLDYNILLTAKTKTILCRKKELTQKDIEEINKKIDYLSIKKGYKRIINEQTPEVAVAEILSYVFEEQNKKNLKRLKYKKI